MFSEFTERSLIKKLGPIYDIRFGGLGEQLGLSEMSKREFEKDAIKLCHEFEEYTLELEEYWLELLLDPLPIQKRTRIESLLGRRLKKTPVSFMAYLKSR